MRFGFILLLIVGLYFRSAAQADNLIASVNSSRDELNPILSPDGNTLYFTIANHPQNIGGKIDPGDIWVSRRVNDSWTQPVHGGPRINDMAYNAVAGFSGNGGQMYLLSHYDQSSKRARTQGIAVAENQAGEWSFPKNISIPYFLNKSSMLSGCFNKTLDVFIFAAENYGTTGVEDLYVTTFENGKWTEPQNLGPRINTRFQELTPWLDEEGRKLYFSTNGRKGIGSFDVYVCERINESWTEWTEPVNLGSPVNSVGRDLFYRKYAAMGVTLFTSTINSDGYSDIKRELSSIEPQIQVSEDIRKKDSVATVVSDPVVSSNDNNIRFFGSVTDAKTNEKIDARIVVKSSDHSLMTEAQGVEGQYQATIKRVRGYSFSVQAPGYLSTFQKLDSVVSGTAEVEIDFQLTRVAAGATVNLQNVLFEQSKAELNPSSYDELDMVVSFLQQNPRVKIELAGHTDNRGVAEDNLRLSQARVNSVRTYLISKGVEPKRVIGKGYGGSRPIASNDTEETRRMNRRVEFTIKKF